MTDWQELPLWKPCYLADVRRYFEVAFGRIFLALEHDRRHRGSSGYETDLNHQVHSKGAEMVLSWVLGRPWPPPEELDYNGDVGDGVQVRYTPGPTNPLPVHGPGPDGYDEWGHDDPDEHTCFLVTGGMSRSQWPPGYRNKRAVKACFCIVGWIEAWEAKQPEFWRTDLPFSPCYMVPQHRLYINDPMLPPWPSP